VNVRGAAPVSCVVLALLLAGCAATAPPAGTAIFFDDFSQADLAGVARDGWQVRDKAGHPGVEGASWRPDAIAVVDDPAQAGNRLLRLRARTDGSSEGTRHAQLCHARKYFEGSYAARIRFSDRPLAGPDGDVIVQTFYLGSPLRFDFDPQYSEVDWEYLPNGGWGDTRTRLYGVTWQTVQLKPWNAFNQAHEEYRALDGWHVLAMQVAGGHVRFFLDGIELARHGGRNYPAVPMSLNFNLWFSPGALLAGTTAERIYVQDVDWVYHAKDRVLSPAQIESAVAALRRTGTARADTVAAADPPLPSPCDF